jgi:leucyl aminopeptidase
MLKSNFADIPNISGGRAAGTITGACFLARFAKNIAGRTSTSPAPPGVPARRRAPPAARCRC